MSVVGSMPLRELRRIRVRGGIAHAFNGSRQQADIFISLGSSSALAALGPGCGRPAADAGSDLAGGGDRARNRCAGHPALCSSGAVGNEPAHLFEIAGSFVDCAAWRAKKSRK